MYKTFVDYLHISENTSALQEQPAEANCRQFETYLKSRKEEIASINIKIKINKERI
jgi:hypothetical protein